MSGMHSSVREYAVLYLGGKKTVGGAVGGGNVLLNAGQHAIDGPEHTGALDISDLSDVDTVTIPPIDGDVLTWIDADGQWEPLAPGGSATLSIDDLTDVDTTSTPPTADQILAWDGLNWVPADAPASSSSAVLWRPLMTTSPHVVTTDGLDEWVVLVTADGEAIMVYS